MSYKYSILATLKDEQVGVLDIADYILYQLNKNYNFAYVDVMGLAEPQDEIWPMLRSSAEAKGHFRTLSKAMTGDTDQDVPCVERAAIEFIKAFRNGSLGKIILDSDSFRK